MSIGVSRIFSLLLLLLVDVAMCVGSFYLASYFVYGNFVFGSASGMLVIVVSCLLSSYLFGGYALRRQLSYLHIPGQMLLAILLTVALVSLIGYITKLIDSDLNYWRAQFIGGMALLFAWLLISRVFIRLLLQKLTIEPLWIILGDKRNAHQIESEMCEVYGEGQFRYIEGGLSGVGNIACHGLVVLPEANNEQNASKLLDIRFSGVRVFNVTEFYERYLFKVPLSFLDKNWFATSAEFGLLQHETQMRIKRIIDVLLSLLLMVVSLPIMLLAGLCVYCNDRGSVFYVQTRVGIADKNFKVYKFRTMIPNAEQKGQPQWTQKNDDRITFVGRFLRVTRIDELPQLWNVLRGDMSFIGPRPERPEFVRKLSQSIALYQYRHAVKPGITGWAQVMYRYGASEGDAAKKLEYDLYYIRNYSLMLDLFIVLRTIRVVLFALGR